MKHDPKGFRRSVARRPGDQAGWLLRAKLERQREARQAAIGAAIVAALAAIGTGAAMHYGSAGGAAVLALAAALATMFGLFAASEA